MRSVSARSRGLSAFGAPTRSARKPSCRNRGRPVWASPSARVQNARQTPEDPRGIQFANRRRAVSTRPAASVLLETLLRSLLLAGIVQVVDERVAQRQDCFRESAHPSFGAFAPDLDHSKEFGLLFVVQLDGAGGVDRGESIADRVAGFVPLKLVQERDAGRPGHGQRVAPCGDRDLVDPLGHGGEATRRRRRYSVESSQPERNGRCVSPTCQGVSPGA